MKYGPRRLRGAAWLEGVGHRGLRFLIPGSRKGITCNLLGYYNPYIMRKKLPKVILIVF